jgi:hypothetical protein
MGGVRITTGLYEDNFLGNPARAASNPKWRLTLIDITGATNESAVRNIRKLVSRDGETYQKLADTTGENNYLKFQTAFPGLYLPNLGRWAFAIGVLSASEINIGLRRSYRVDPIVITEVGPAITIARRFLPGDTLKVGLTARGSYRLATRKGLSFIDFIRTGDLKPKDTASDGVGFDFDTGATYDLPIITRGFEWSMGLSINQILNGKLNQFSSGLAAGGDVSQSQTLSRSLNFGVSTKRDSVGRFFKDFIAAIELTDIGNNENGSIFRNFHCGAESRILQILRLRIGFNQGWPTAGVGLTLPFMELDAATWGEELTYNAGGLEDRRFGVRVSFFL